MAGRPRGTWADKAFRDALRVAVLEKQDGFTKLRKLAEQLVSAGMAGDVSAIKEVADRLDGKATQQVEATIRDERMVVEAPPVSKDADEWASKHGPH